MKDCDHGYGETIATMEGWCAVCGRDLMSRIADAEPMPMNDCISAELAQRLAESSPRLLISRPVLMPSENSPTGFVLVVPNAR